MSQSSGMLAGIAIALVIGGAGGYAIKNSMHEDHKKSAGSVSLKTDTPAADLRVLLNGLEQEHVALASNATRAGFDGTPSFEPAAGSLDKNSRDLAAAVGSVYGKEAETTFYEIWNSHVG